MTVPSPVAFISPLDITAVMVTSSTAVKRLAGELDWNANTAYTKGMIVVRPDLGRRFENKIPGTDSSKPEDAQDRWYDLGVADKMAMFDSEEGTQSIAPVTLTTVIRPGAFNAMYLAGLVARTLSITVKDAPNGTEIYSYTGSLEDSQPADYYEYFFSPYKPKTEFLVTGLTPYARCEVTITLVNPGGVARCGIASLGDLVSLGGPAMRGVTVKPNSSSKVSADERGKARLKKGKSARDLTIRAQVPMDEVDSVIDALDQVMGVPCTWIGSDLKNLRSLRTFGLGKGEFTYDSDIVADLYLSVQGMV